MRLCRVVLCDLALSSDDWVKVGKTGLIFLLSLAFLSSVGCQTQVSSAGKDHEDQLGNVISRIPIGTDSDSARKEAERMGFSCNRYSRNMRTCQMGVDHFIDPAKLPAQVYIEPKKLPKYTDVITCNRRQLSQAGVVEIWYFSLCFSSNKVWTYHSSFEAVSAKNKPAVDEGGR